ncbi:MAG: zf-HC2 domain-containing protein [Gemmatimonadetes bacterium]|nr:zf-HC2 domain-containing protein [Gemmatimonadota bacterium]
MMKCDQVKERLWAFVDGELALEEEQAVREHLELCGRCFPQYDWHRAYARYVRSVASRMADPAVRRRVFERLLRESQKPDTAQG